MFPLVHTEISQRLFFLAVRKALTKGPKIITDTLFIVPYITLVNNMSLRTSVFGLFSIEQSYSLLVSFFLFRYQKPKK